MPHVDLDAEQLYTATAAVLDASTRVAAGTGSGVIDEHLHCAVDLADGLQVASTVLMLGLARKLILLRASRQSVTLNGNAELSVVEAANIGAGTHTRNVTSRPEMTSRNNSPNDARSLNDMLEKEAYEKGSKHDVNTAAFHRQWTPKNAAQWVEELKLQDRTDPSNPQNLPPGEADKEADHTRPHQDRSRLHNVLRGHAHRTTSQSKGNQNARQGQPRPPSDSRQMRRRHHTKDEVLHTSAYLPTGKSPVEPRT